MRALEREPRRVRRPSSAQARAAWQQIAEGLLEHSRVGAEAGDIEGARAAFEHQSTQLRALLEQFGNPLANPVRVAYCPMAFDNRGAEWVQRGAEIDNPYFGDLMRRCGEIRATVEPGSHLASREGAAPARPAPSGGHGGHGP